MRTPEIAPLALIVFLSALVPNAHATINVFTDKARFLTVTQATNCTGPLPDLGKLPGGEGGSFTAGRVTFTLSPRGEPRWSLYSGQWTDLLPGFEIGIDHTEDLNANFDEPVFSAGFDLVDSTVFPGVTCPGADSTFNLTLKNGTNTIAVFGLNPTNDIGSFIGVHSSLAFNRIEIRETSGGCEDDYFGEFYCGMNPLFPPASIRVSEVEVCWPSQSNRVYSVDYSSGLTTNVWLPLFTKIVASGETTCVYDKVFRGEGQRLYRVICLPEEALR